MRRAMVGSVVGALAAAVVLSATPVGAAGRSPQAATWGIETTPNPTNGDRVGSELTAVSCVSATSCTAVGVSVTGAGGDLTLAEGWNGTTWSAETTPDPTGAASSSLAGVSCRTGGCIAVGSYTKTDGIATTLAESSNGKTWSLLTLPKPKGAANGAFLQGVSCPPSGDCIAVGYVVNGLDEDRPLAESWNGTAWTVLTTPLPKSASQSALDGVSCPSSSSCTAVGFYDPTDSGAQLNTALGWNGTSWKVQSVPSLSGSDTNVLAGVSCPSAGACQAVGSSSAGTIAEELSAGKWSIETTPNPKNALEVTLDAVSCAASPSCEAVGSYLNDRDRPVTLAEGLGAGKWSIQTTPDPKGSLQEIALSGVSCTAPTACTAAGNSETGTNVFSTLAERYA